MLCWSQAALISRWDSSLSFGGQCYRFFWFWMDVYKTVVACFIDPACPISIPGCLGMLNLNPPVLLGWTEVPGTSSCYTLAFSWWKQLCSSDCTLADLFLTYPDGLPSNEVVKTICANHHWRPNNRLLSFLGQRIPLSDSISSAFDRCIAEGGQPFGVDFDLLSVMPSGRTDSQFVSWHYCDRFLAWKGLIISLLQSII